MNGLKNLYVDANEEHVATLGGEYINNFLMDGDLSKGFCEITNRRVYFLGKTFIKTGIIYRESKAEKAIDLKDITGSGFSDAKTLKAIVAAVIGTFGVLFGVSSFITSIKGSMYGSIIGHSGYAVSAQIIGIWFSIALTIISIILSKKLYKKNMGHIFEINYAGGQIAFWASDYSENEIQEFQKALRMAKDKYVERESTPKVVIAENTGNSIGDELRQYKELLDSGAITEEEFGKLKKKIIGM